MTGFFGTPKSRRQSKRGRLVGAWLSRNVRRRRDGFVSAVVLHSEFVKKTRSKIEYSEFCALASTHGYKISTDQFLENAVMRYGGK